MHSNTPDPNTASPRHFPEPVRLIVRLIEKNGSDEVSQLLANFVASTVHPDFVCNLASFDAVNREIKTAVLEFFDHCVFHGLTLDEKNELLNLVNPTLMGQPRPVG